MNFNQLKYIIAVDRERNFARAAEECRIAQSTLSKEIQRLESEFNIIIFDRSRRPVTPTLKGIDLIEQAKTILEAQQEFIHIAQKRENQPTGEFHLGILPTLAPYLLPLFINALNDNYPELQVEITELTSREMVAKFEANTLDAAIAIRPFFKPGYYEAPLFKEDFVLYMNTRHPLAPKKEIEWTEIPMKELLLHEAFRSYLLSSDELKDKTQALSEHLAHINYQSGSLETIRKIIDSHGGLTLLPQLSCRYMGKRRLKSVRPIVNPVLSRMIALITPRGFEKRRITKVLKREILKGVNG